MSDEEFLARWSRRKHEARSVVDAPPPEQAEALNSALSATAAHPEDAEVDLSSLPPIESITGATDITAFLRRGIPPELSRAALRRAWAADPAIRDFVGLAENAWDFNDPNAMPGFGPLDYSEQQLATLVDSIVGHARSVADGLTTALKEQKDISQSVDSDDKAPSDLRTSEAVDDLSAGEGISSSAPPTAIAVQPGSPQSAEGDQASVRHRTHGAALPR